MNFTPSTYGAQNTGSRMHMLSQVQEPAEFPITIDEAKAHARVEVDAEDVLIEGLIRSAVDYAEWFTQRAFIRQEWELLLDCFPLRDRTLELPKAPLQEVVSIVYLDSSGVEQTWDPESYKVLAPSGPTAGRGVIVLKSPNRWPVAFHEPYGVTIRFFCGYGTEDESAEYVPAGIKAALLMHVAEMYENRENRSTEASQSVRDLLWPYMVDKLGI